MILIIAFLIPVLILLVQLIRFLFYGIRPWKNPAFNFTTGTWRTIFFDFSL